MVVDPKSLFRPGELAKYDFSRAPETVARIEASAIVDDEWADAQEAFLRWTKDRRVFTREMVETGLAAGDALFARRGRLTGKVLDIGGGWGLYRQWWDPSEDALFVVHDPGIERFARGPHDLHHEFYEVAFARPMTFVQGFGEELPYADGAFDTCLIASALDHCLDPGEVFASAHRCLRPGGTLLVLQSCPPPEVEHARPPFFTRLARHLLNPRRFLFRLYGFFRHPDRHLRHFEPESLREMIGEAGFEGVDVKQLPEAEYMFVFEGKK